MATKTLTSAAASARLECLVALCNDLAHGISSAQSVLRSNAEDADVAHLVADALARLGVIADRAMAIASSNGANTIKGLDEWIFDETLVELLQTMEAAHV